MGQGMENQCLAARNYKDYNASGRSSPAIVRDRPTFLFIGAMTSGVSWIAEALRDHPSVFIPVARELQFFNNHYDRGWEWYLRYFKNAGPASALGELTADYWSSEAAARRIRQHLPEVRLICCLREPGDFAASLLRWFRNHDRYRYGSTFREMTENPFFSQLLAYRKHLEVYFDLFPRDQIRVVYYEHMKSDPRRFVRELYRFVCVDPDYRPAALTQSVDDARSPRSRMLLRAGTAGAAFLRRRGAHTLAGAARPVFDKLVYSGAVREEEPAEAIELERIAENVRRQAAGDLEALARLVGMPLPAEWTSEAAREQTIGRRRGIRLPAASMTYAEL
jgi:hypothetical protein